MKKMTRKARIAEAQQKVVDYYMPLIADAEAKTHLNFVKEEDREYWIEKLAELKIKMATGLNNAEYFVTMAVYDR